ncbi:response regulator [Deinococcus radiopugnans]|uniref:DNA-binding NarL/FixJ family response regulator n=1 Tax=Deinococcus radiopugnans ATCC 19172 TaxID=585398 RepID=A0A5C4YB14_9DEIO|nr:response regulator transcription factor [Deinococcus radiopugnans]MBB6015976.1 DNA-binding NarL/FixJ family response regulator [Deinococcus radiopugnans ATCC 19172]TNM72335.1 response regulator transcription factor [Deinococcus radiopugnans ATCC 19172]
MITVGLVDDQPLVRAGFSMLINSQPDMQVLFQAGDGSQLAEQPAVDVMLMDIQMPVVDGITATGQVLRRDPHVKVIMLTTFDHRGFVTGAIEAGASGFLLKDAQPEELLAAIRIVHAGEAVLSPRATAHVLSALQGDGRSGQTNQAMLEVLTARERDILRLIALGLSNDEMARRELLSMATVKTHVRHILMKTDSRDRVHAVLYAYRAGLVTIQELLSQPQME